MELQCPHCKGAMKDLEDAASHKCHEFPLRTEPISTIIAPTPAKTRRDQILPKANYLNKPKIPCKKCGEEFNIEKHWALHMQLMHDEEKPYECQHCDQKFANPQIVKAHTKRIHEKKFDFICELCGQEFFFNYKLTEHMKRHTEEGIEFKPKPRGTVADFA